MSTVLSFESWLDFQVNPIIKVFEQTPLGKITKDIIQVGSPWGGWFNWETKGSRNHLLSGKWRWYFELWSESGDKVDWTAQPLEVKVISKPHCYEEEVIFDSVPEGHYWLIAWAVLEGPEGIQVQITEKTKVAEIQFWNDAENKERSIAGQPASIEN